MKRGDFFREELDHEKVTAALTESNEATLAHKHEFARELWESERAREAGFREKSDRTLAIPVVVLTTILGSGILALANEWAATPVAHGLLVATILFSSLSGLAAIYYGHGVIRVRFGQSISPGIALERHETEAAWHTTTATAYLLAYKKDLRRMDSYAFNTRLAQEWTLLMVLGAILGTAATAVVWALESEVAPQRLDVTGAALALLAWTWTLWRLVWRPKPHKPVAPTRAEKR